MKENDNTVVEASKASVWEGVAFARFLNFGKKSSPSSTDSPLGRDVIQFRNERKRTSRE